MAKKINGLLREYFRAHAISINKDPEKFIAEIEDGTVDSVFYTCGCMSYSDIQSLTKIVNSNTKGIFSKIKDIKESLKDPDVHKRI